MANLTRALVCAVVALALVAGVATAPAGATKGKGGEKAQQAAKARGAAKARLRGCVVKRVRLAAHVLRPAAAHLGITARQLRLELSGSSLAQVAQARGKTAAGLQQALVDAKKAKLDRLVARGKLTQQRADALLARFQERVGTLVNKVFRSPGMACLAAAARGVALKAAFQHLGLTKQQLRQQLPGHSLAELATAQGKSVDGLKAAMTDAVKAALDRAVATRKLSQDVADAVLARFQAQLDAMVNAVTRSK